MFFGIKYPKGVKKAPYNTKAKQEAKAKIEANKLKRQITRERLMEEVRYDPLTGDFFWLRSKQGRRGILAQSINSGTRHNCYLIDINHVRYEAHKMAWLYMTGESPGMVLHKDGNKFNNKFDNLYPCNRVEYNKKFNKIKWERYGN